MQAGQLVVAISGRDVTRDLLPGLLSWEYVDHLRGESDELTLSLEDRDGRWLGDWWPTKGDSVTSRFARHGRALVHAGDFTLDQVEHEGPPRVIRLKALAASPQVPARTPTSTAFVGQTLRQVAEAKAKGLGLDLVGQVPAIPLPHVTQRHLTDLAFLGRLARDFGLVFSIRGRQMIWTSLADLEAQAASAEITPATCLGWRLTHALTRVYRSAEVASYRPQHGKAITTAVQAEGEVSGDVLRVAQRADTPAQAVALGKAALREANRKAVQASFDLPGTEELLSGLVVQVRGWGAFDGRYLVDVSRHAMDAGGGYTTSVDLSLVGR